MEPPGHSFRGRAATMAARRRPQSTSGLSWSAGDMGRNGIRSHLAVQPGRGASPVCATMRDMDDTNPGAPRPLFVPTETAGVAVRTADQLIVGLLHAHPHKRLKDELNGTSDRYLALTEARVYDSGGNRLLYEASVVLMASTHIVSVTPLSAVRPGECSWSALLAAPRESQ